MDRFKKKFLEEANDLTNNLENALLRLDINNVDEPLIQEIFRIMHTIKGNSAMFGFKRIDEYTHNLESIYDLVRNNKISLSKEILDISFIALDHINTLLKHENDLPADLNEIHEKLLKGLLKMVEDLQNESKGAKPKATESVSSEPAPVKEEQKIEAKTEEQASAEAKTITNENVFYIFFEPKPEIFKFGNNPFYLVEDVTKLGTARVYPKYNKLPNLGEIDPQLCYTNWEIVLITESDINSIKDVFIFVEDDCNIEIIKIENIQAIDENFYSSLDAIGYSDTYIDPSSISSTIKANEKDVAKTEVEVVEIDAKQSEPAVEVVEPTQETSKKHEVKVHHKKPVANAVVPKDSSISSIRVSSEKLDGLMNLISEMVTLQARISLISNESENSELAIVSENLEKVSRRLRDTAFNICLIPLESILTRFQRLIRDVSVELNKEVQFITKGAETELDKNIIEGLTDPIMHIIRNSLDHGLETKEKRIENNKSAKGTIKLEAYYSGTNVYIEISDDGGGINTSKLRDKAIQKGLINTEDVLSHKELLELIFAPGLSTAAKLTELSGRGVGMDVVKRKIKDLRGEVEIDSELNVGTKITIKLPLTLSIIDGLLVKVGDTLYIIPLNVVNFIFSAPKSKINSFNDLIVHNGEEIPYVYLRKEFNENDDEHSYLQFIVVNYKDYKVGIIIDEVIGEYQAVLKPIGKLFKHQDFVSGATILGDGTIALVLDTNRIIREFSQKTI